jgi:hypothetical protein
MYCAEGRRSQGLGGRRADREERKPLSWNSGHFLEEMPRSGRNANLVEIEDAETFAVRLDLRPWAVVDK